MLARLSERMKLIEDALNNQQNAISKLQQDSQQAMADLNAIQGARQELGFWISTLQKEEAEKQPETCVDPNCNDVVEGEVV